MLISQSEADSRNSCHRKHYYAFGEPITHNVDPIVPTEETLDIETESLLRISHGIEPLSFGVALTRGTIGHKALEEYYAAIIRGESFEDARRHALVSLSKAMIENPDHSEIVSELTGILTGYFEHYGQADLNEWEPLAVEQEFRFEIPKSDGLVFPFRVDAIFRKRRTAQMYVVDHKFVYNWYLPNTIRIMPQMPKYIFALRSMGYDITDGMYNMLSTRKNSKDPYRRAFTDTTDIKAKQFFREQLQTMLEIRGLKEMPNDEWERLHTRRNANAFNCKNCMFLELCAADLEGMGGRRFFIEANFKPNTYGYGKEIEAE